MKIEIDYEVTFRTCVEVEVTQDELEMIRDGEIPETIQAIIDKDINECIKDDDGFVDYAVTDEEGRTIVDWD